MTFDVEKIDWAKTDGLIPAIMQDATTLRVLMLGYMDREALNLTLQTRRVTFFSRSKQRLWEKGETSGHGLDVQSLQLDCDGDALLVRVTPHGPTCHTGTETCWGDDRTPSLATLADLAATIKARRQAPATESYTAQLFSKGLTRIAQKVGEEGVETALAGATRAANLTEEAADLLYHLLVLLEARDVALGDVLTILHRRAVKKEGGRF